VTFVLDNSVAMRWCFEETAHPYAESILDRLEAGEEAVVPVMWLYEASAVLARAQNRGTLAAPKAGEFIDELQSLNISADLESVARIFPDVHHIALTHRLTSYDASHLELALRRGLPLATLDDRLIRASQAPGISIITWPHKKPHCPCRQASSPSPQALIGVRCNRRTAQKTALDIRWNKKRTRFWTTASAGHAAWQKRIDCKSKRQ